MLRPLSRPPTSGPAFYFDIGAGRVFRRFELAAADLARGNRFLGVMRLQPF